MTSSRIQAWQQELDGKSPSYILRWAARQFPNKVTLASALGLEAQILTHMIAREDLDIPVFTLDTGRLFDETHDLIERTRTTYKIPIRVLFPDRRDVESLVNTHGTNLFRQDHELRKQCCDVRKVVPLQRALEGFDAWMTGLRADQTQHRQSAQVVNWDENRGMVKINPLVNWTSKQVWSFVRKERVPYNQLMDRGFASIGCAACTRAIRPGEDERAGRWWWESGGNQECGLHLSQPATSALPTTVPV